MRRTFTIVAALTLAGLVPAQQAAAAPLTTQDLTTLTPQDLVDSLVGAGVTTSNVTYAGASTAGGGFGGGAGILGPDFDTGVVLSSGAIASLIGPNDAGNTTTAYGTPGDADLAALVGGATFDAAVLEFDFVPDADTVFFRYVFGSEEYNEFVNSNFDDVFGFFVNGTNCATVGEGQRVSINTINSGSNASLYRNNEPPTIDIELDGLTTILTCEAPVDSGAQNHIKLAIADKGDQAWDSAVFLEGGSFSTTPPEEEEEEEGTDLAVTKSDTPDPVTADGVVQYLVDVENQGELASGVTLTDAPSDGEILGASGAGWDCTVHPGGEGPAFAECTFEELAPGASAPTVEVLVRAPSAPGTITNTATVEGDATDPDPADNEAVEETTVIEGDEDQAITYCPPSGCELQTGDEPNEDDNTVNHVEVPAGGDGSVARISEGTTTFPCGGNTGTGEDGSGQETDFLPPTGLADPTDPIKVTTTWDVSVWPIHKGSSDPGVSNGKRGTGQVKICMQKPVDDGEGGTTTVVFRVPRCENEGIADPAPCWDQVSRDADGDISVRFLMLSEDPQWRR